MIISPSIRFVKNPCRNNDLPRVFDNKLINIDNVNTISTNQRCLNECVEMYTINFYNNLGEIINNWYFDDKKERDYNYHALINKQITYKG